MAKPMQIPFTTFLLGMLILLALPLTANAARWNECDGEGPITWDHDELTLRLRDSDFPPGSPQEIAIRAAITTVNNEPGRPVELHVTHNDESVHYPDSDHSVSFSHNHQDDGSIGHAETFRICIPYVFAEILDADIYFEPNFDWNYGAYTDAEDSWSSDDEASITDPNDGVVSFEQVALHEIGHALGLEHETRWPVIMYPQITANPIGSNLGLQYHGDDLHGLRSIYGTHQSVRDYYASTHYSYHPQAISAGQSFEVEYELGNRGTIHEPYVFAHLVLSLDENFNDQSDIRQYDTYWILPPGAAPTRRTATFRVPEDLPTGLYYVGIRLTDNGQGPADIDPANNTARLGRPIEVFAQGTTLPPTAVSATDGVYTDRIVISWQNSELYNDIFIYRTEGAPPSFGCSGTPIASKSINNFNTSFTDTTVGSTPMGYTYYYSLRSLKNGNYSPCSNINPGFRASTPSPTPITASNGNDDRVTLNWTSVSGASHYNIYAIGANGNPTVPNVPCALYSSSYPMRTVYGASTRQADVTPNLPLPFYWKFAVTAVKNGQESLVLNEGNCAIGSFNGIRAPSSVVATDGEFNHIDVYWSLVPGAVAYEVYRATYSASQCGGSPIASVAAPSLGSPATYRDLTSAYYNPIYPGTTYYYRIKSVEADGSRSICSTATDSGWAKKPNIRPTTSSPVPLP